MPEVNEKSDSLLDDMFDVTEKAALKSDLDANNLTGVKEKLAAKGITSETDIDTALAELTGEEKDIKHVVINKSKKEDMGTWEERTFFPDHKKAVRMRFAVRIVITQLMVSGTKVNKKQFKAMVNATYQTLRAFS